MRGILVADATWPVIEQRLIDGAIAVLPIGAGSKEHGRHLPMNTDQLQVEWIADRLRRRFDVLVWPTVTYGYYPVFMQYPGSTSVSSETFAAMAADILHSIHRSGAGRVVILNTGISTIEPLQGIVDRHTGSAEYQLINVYSGANYEREVAEISEQCWGGHADEVETSIVLALDARRVDMSQARSAPQPIARGLFNRRDPQAHNYSPDGVNGDPSLAATWKGERLLGALLQDVIDAIEKRN